MQSRQFTTGVSYTSIATAVSEPASKSVLASFNSVQPMMRHHLVSQPPEFGDKNRVGDWSWRHQVCFARPSHAHSCGLRRIWHMRLHPAGDARHEENDIFVVRSDIVISLSNVHCAPVLRCAFQLVSKTSAHFHEKTRCTVKALRSLRRQKSLLVSSLRLLERSPLQCTQ